MRTSSLAEGDGEVLLRSFRLFTGFAGLPMRADTSLGTWLADPVQVLLYIRRDAAAAATVPL